jgi:hypothetical protein
MRNQAAANRVSSPAFSKPSVLGRRVTRRARPFEMMTEGAGPVRNSLGYLGAHYGRRSTARTPAQRYLADKAALMRAENTSRQKNSLRCCRIYRPSEFHYASTKTALLLIERSADHTPWQTLRCSKASATGPNCPRVFRAARQQRHYRIATA